MTPRITQYVLAYDIFANEHIGFSGVSCASQFARVVWYNIHFLRGIYIKTLLVLIVRRDSSIHDIILNGLFFGDSGANVGLDQRGEGGGRRWRSHACMGGPGNVFTIHEKVYIGALRGESLLRWMMCKPPWIILL